MQRCSTKHATERREDCCAGGSLVTLAADEDVPALTVAPGHRYIRHDGSEADVADAEVPAVRYCTQSCQEGAATGGGG